MAAVRSADTQPELKIRKGLFALGHRFRLGSKYKRKGKYLPGKPDIVIPGSFWHGHGCHLFKWPKTEAAWWRNKILGNIARDDRVRDRLRSESWRIAEVWECTLKGPERRPDGEVLDELDQFIRSEATRLVIGPDQAVTISEDA
jgi:DNA mismatch endonuclease (patch repair protein)